MLVRAEGSCPQPQSLRLCAPLCPPPFRSRLYYNLGRRGARAVPIGTALHEKTFPLCESLSYREWSGYYAVSSYEIHHEHEYNAIRNAAALIDITPLYKYRLTGKDATRLVDRIITRDMRKVTVGQVVYTP